MGTTIKSSAINTTVTTAARVFTTHPHYHNPLFPSYCCCPHHCSTILISTEFYSRIQLGMIPFFLMVQYGTESFHPFFRSMLLTPDGCFGSSIILPSFSISHHNSHATIVGILPHNIPSLFLFPSPPDVLRPHSCCCVSNRQQLIRIRNLRMTLGNWNG